MISAYQKLRRASAGAFVKIMLANKPCIAYNISCSIPLAGVMELVDVADSKSADGNIMWVRVPPPAPARHKRHIACDELFIKAHRSLILLCLAFRPANASLVYRARELRNTKISELLPPDTSECACAAVPPLRIEPAASGFSLALGAGPKAAAPIRLQYNKRSEQSSPCSDLFAFSGKEHHPPAPLMRSIPGVRG